MGRIRRAAKARGFPKTSTMLTSAEAWFLIAKNAAHSAVDQNNTFPGVEAMVA